MLNGKELIAREIITGEIPAENVQQHGIDLNLVAVERVMGIGKIPFEGKTVLPSYQEVIPIEGVWKLNPGTYNITFAQGCNIPNDQMLLIRQRSSLLRCGGILHSSVFDAGFKTDAIGTFMTIMHPVDIEVGARIAQIYNHQTTPVDNLYDGQWQGDKQRANENSN